MKNQQLKYLLYATLLDSYQDYLDYDKIFNEYYGNSEILPFTCEEFGEIKRSELIDRINRVPMKWEDSEKADRGTAFNIVIDYLISGEKPEKGIIENIYANPETYFDSNIGDGYDGKGVVAYKITYNNRTFIFPISICREFADYYEGAVPQAYTEAILPTKYGDVKLYGNIDELMPSSVHDIKTTVKYSTGKFKNHWQSVAYPYCLNASGNEVHDFEYNILLISSRASGDTYETFTEHYNYVPEVDVPRLTAHVESLIEFIEANKDSISDLKIFNKHE